MRVRIPERKFGDSKKTDSAIAREPAKRKQTYESRFTTKIDPSYDSIISDLSLIKRIAD